MNKTTLRIGTRGSALALWQAEWVKARLEHTWPDLHVELVPIKTSGDRIQDVALATIGGKGLFVKEIEAMGMRMHVAAGHRIPNLNTVVVPDGCDELAVRKRLLNEYGIEISGGFGPLAGKIFRVGIMGPLATGEGVAMFLNAFKTVLGK